MESNRKKLEGRSSTFEETQLKEHYISIESNYEEFLDLTGNGKFSHMVLSACAFGLLAVGFQNGVTAYLIPSAKCDLQITTNQIGYVNAVFMIGGISSACIWGLAADMIGRKKILLITLISDSLVTMLSALSRDYSMLLIMRFFNGFFIGGPGCLVFTYLGDLIPIKRRIKYIYYIGFCFILSWIFLPALAFLVLPMKFQILMQGNFKFNSWRLYLLLSAIPSVISAALFYKLPESPRLLLANKNKTEALNVLKNMFSINTGLSDKNTWCYGFGLWIPELLSRFQKYNNDNVNSSTTVCQLTNYAIAAVPNVTSNSSSNKMVDYFYESVSLPEMTFNCESKMDYQGFKDTMAIGMACLFYNVISVYVSDIVSAKLLPAASLAIAGVAATTFLWVSSPLYCLAAASVFQAAMITGNIVIVGLVMCAYPSHMSSMAVCIATLAGRVGSICSNLFFGSFMDASCQIPIFLVATLSIGAAFLVLFVKDHKNEEDDAKQMNLTDDIKMGSTGKHEETDFQTIDLNQVTEHI